MSDFPNIDPTPFPDLAEGAWVLTRNGWVIGPVLSSRIPSSPYKFRCSSWQNEMAWTVRGKYNAFSEEPLPFDVVGAYPTREAAMKAALEKIPTTVAQVTRYMLVSPSAKKHLRYLNTLGGLETLRAAGGPTSLPGQPAAVFTGEWMRKNFAMAAEIFGHMETVYALGFMTPEDFKRLDPDDPAIVGYSVPGDEP